MEILYTAIAGATGLALIRFVPFFASTPLSVKWVQILFMLKLLAGIALGLVYTHYYSDRSTADVFKYFDDGRTIFNVIRQSPTDYLRLVSGIGSDAEWLKPYLDQTQHWFKPYDHSMYNDNRTIIRFNALLMLFSGGYFFIHTAIMSFLSFTGTFALFKYIHGRTHTPVTINVICVFLLPTFLFWTSGLLKEGLLIFGLGMLFLSADKIQRTGSAIKYWTVLLLSVGLLSITKYYVLASIVPGLIIWIWSAASPRKLFAATLIVHLSVFAFLFVNSIWPVGADVVGSIVCKRNDFISFAASLPTVGSLIDMQKIEMGFFPLIAQLPEAIFNAFFLPLPWSSVSAISMLPLAENIVFIALVGGCIWHRRTHIVDKPSLVMWLSFTIILYALSGLTTPVIGALVRYKSPAMPFLFAALSSMIDWDKTFFNNILIYTDKHLQNDKK